MASTIPAAGAAITAGLRTLTGEGEPLENVAVYDLGVWDTTDDWDRIVVGPATDIERTIDALGTNVPMTERYTLPLTFETRKLGRDFTGIRERLWEIVAAFEAWLKADEMELDNSVSVALPTDFEDEEVEASSGDEDQIVARVTVLLRCEAHIHLGS